MGYFICRLYDEVGQKRAEQSRARESFFFAEAGCHSKDKERRKVEGRGGGDNVGAKEGQETKKRMSSEAQSQTSSLFFVLLSDRLVRPLHA